MKIGIRTPSPKKSISARTTGKAKRKLKRMMNPFYGKKGTAFIKSPGKAIKAKIYKKTTISTKSAVKGAGGCLCALFMIPLYLIWYMLKYIFLGIAWAFVLLINGCIALVEWFINLNRKDDIVNDETFNDRIDNDNV